MSILKSQFLGHVLIGYFAYLIQTQHFEISLTI